MYCHRHGRKCHFPPLEFVSDFISRQVTRIYLFRLVSIPSTNKAFGMHSSLVTRRYAMISLFTLAVSEAGSWGDEPLLIASSCRRRIRFAGEGPWQSHGVNGKPFRFTLGEGKKARFIKKRSRQRILRTRGCRCNGVAEWCYHFTI